MLTSESNKSYNEKEVNMQEKIVLASNNSHKIAELKKMFPNENILPMSEVGFTEEIEENGTTFLENSLIKARAVAEFLKKKGIVASVVADDSGLCVDALDGRPGVYSARYAKEHDDKANRQKLLQEMKGKRNRSAHYVCVIVKLFPNGRCVHVEGKTYGRILEKELGENGFGFDPLFYSNDLKKTFAQATNDEKNSVSHRGRAIEALRKIK